jgi:hypothetical protein
MTADAAAERFLHEAAGRWRDMDRQLTWLRLKLEDDAVPSYRVGAAEGFTLFRGIGELGELVEQSFHDLQAVARSRNPNAELPR